MHFACDGMASIPLRCDACMLTTSMLLNVVERWLNVPMVVELVTSMINNKHAYGCWVSQDDSKIIRHIPKDSAKIAIISLIGLQQQ